MPAEPAPGQAAYEAHAAMVVPRPWRWDQLDDQLRAAWATAAAVVTVPLNAELGRLREEAASLREQLATMDEQARQAITAEASAVRELESERDRLRVDLDDLASHWEHAGCAYPDDGSFGYARELREALEGGG